MQRAGGAEPVPAPGLDPDGCAGPSVRQDAGAVGDDVRAFLQGVYRPFDTPGGLVQAVLEALEARPSIAGAEARFRFDDGRLTSARLQAVSRVDGGTQPVCRVPLVSGRHAFGEIAVAGSGPEVSDADSRLLRGLAPVLARLLGRYQLRACARLRLGADLWFVGLAPCLLALEDRLAEAAPVEMPLLIRGDFGTETRTVAFAAHVASRSARPFVEVPCGELADVDHFRATLAALGPEAGAGTLYLSDVDELDGPCQRVLVEFLGPAVIRGGMWLAGGYTRSPAPYRIMASTATSLRRLCERGTFSKRLWSTLDGLGLRVPPLRDRRSDIPHLIDHFAGAAADNAIHVSPEAAAALSAWDWPGNLVELERTLAGLAATAPRTGIDMAHLKQWAGDIADGIGAVALAGEPAAPAPETTAATDDGSSGQPSFVLARQLLARRFDGLTAFHPGLQRALTHLALHFDEEIALDALARESFVSASYLCALFKKSLGMGFKRFQSILRVERAKDLLVTDQQHRITDIALDVGFGDFSHFLKTFKRYTHISPREFRKRRSPACVVDPAEAGS